ncbi:variant surface glycoprotein (VSG), putative [Trypanosoma brucei brucei TREU927]|uniref:Variant surface glycoprotein (VSG), putative n=1 Tax=Trypanosoma brucei brucei (strain 927/4 GUTat10.1) TaxID=185431 RepID=Q387P0_TRYB2|nr:variant surface glycoprotein (VSG), putative [Trypanosoma brucei brucei TREU927]EAN78982.1 variant surface glycoprotein (VSG), putative [Trypanosoma brucei brucei TREU927]
MRLEVRQTLKPNVTKRALATLTVLTTAALRAEAAFKADAAADMHLLCAAMAIEKVEPAAPTLADNFDNDISELRRMNMSTADDSWRSNFKGDPKTDTWESRSKAGATEPFVSHWKADFGKWQQDYQTAEVANKPKTWLADNPQPQGTYAKKVAHKLINDTLTELITKIADYAQTKHKIAQAGATKVKELISEALYGAGQTSFEPKSDATYKYSSNYGTACGGNGGMSIAGDLLCICCQATTGTTNACDNSGIQCDWSSNNMNNHIATVRKKCPTSKPSKLTLAGLIQLAAQLKAGIRKGAKGTAVAFYLGGSHDTCDGTTDQTCVDYTAHYGAGGTKSGVNSIPWIVKLNDAIETMEEMEKNAQKAREEAKEIRMLIAAAKRAYRTAIEPSMKQSNEPAKSSEGQTKMQQPSETEDSCNKKGQNECNSPCKWNPEAEGKKCKLDKEEVKKIADEVAKDAKTNTTGSNSFVISKGPLLLAFLLF